MAKETYYFSHDSNAITDTKILNMRCDYGLEGYGLYWVIIEMLRNEQGYKLELNKNTYRAIKTLANPQNIDIEKFIRDCIDDYKLFIKEDNCFYSKSLSNRMLEYEEKKRINKENGKLGGRPKKTETKPFGFENETEKNQSKIKESKIKENKVKEKNNNNTGESCLDGLQEVIDFYNNNIGMITPYGLEILEDYLKELGKELVIYAMQISVEANKRTIQYIKAILNNWSKAGIKTLIEAKQESEKKKARSNKVKNECEQRTYTDSEFDSFYANKQN